MLSIAVVTPLFPIPREPYRGKAIYRTVVGLQKHARVRVFCPLAVYPKLTGTLHHAVDDSYRPPGVEDVRYFPYRAWPFMSRSLNGEICRRRLQPEIEQARPDLVLSYWIYPEGYAAVQASRNFGVPVILGARGSDLRRIQDPLTLIFSRRGLREADSVLTVSEDLKDRAVAMGANPTRTWSIPNGCDTAIFHPGASTADGRESVRRRFPDGARLILFVGRLDAAKGLQELVVAFHALASQDGAVRLVLAGEGRYRSRLEAFAAQHGISDRLHFAGQLKSAEVAAWMDAADVFCLPSHSEGCPNVVLEAISCGCPVVASNVGGIPEIAPPEGSILIPPHAPEQLEAALRKALARSWDRHEIARLFARSWDQVAAETYQVCENVVNRSAVRAVAGRTGPGARKRLKITVITSYFPIAAEPYRGHSAYHTLRRMQKMADIEVICPMAVYPRVKWLNPRGFRYHRPDLSYSPPDMKATYLEYPVLPVVTRPINGLTCAHYLRPYVRASRPDVILNYWIYPDGFGAVRLGREMGVPVIVGSIGSDIRRPGDPLSAHLMRSTLLTATGVITVSEELRRRAIELGVPPENVTTVLNGCDFEVFHPRDRERERREAGIDLDAELLLYVGWLSPTKGLSELMEATIALAATRPRLRLAMIGEGSYRQTLAERAQQAGLADRVLLLGRMDSEGVSRWLGMSNVFCLPSYSEGCPNAVVEAIASGRPVVATDVGGIPELVRNGCGILVPPMDSTRLREALERALTTNWDEPGIAQHFGRPWTAAAEETFEICLRVAEGR